MANDTPKGKKVCISCQTEVEGKKAFPVKEDRIIKGIRAIKKALGIAQMNQLYVCDKCMPNHSERRKSFEKTMLFASVLAGFMLLIILLAPLLSGRFDAGAIVAGIVVSLFVLSLPLFKYVPAIDMGLLPPQPFQPPSPPMPEPEPMIAKKAEKKMRKKR